MRRTCPLPTGPQHWPPSTPTAIRIRSPSSASGNTCWTSSPGDVSGAAFRYHSPGSIPQYRGVVCVVSVLSLNCPVCGAPFSPGADRCGYCGSILVLQSDHPRIDPRALNRAVVNEKISSYRDLLRQDPHSVKAHYGLGVAYFNLGLTEAAIDSLEKACSITPENPHIHTQLAVAWREEARTGDKRAIEEMRDHVQYALRLDPNNVEALILASEMAASDHDVQTAVDFSERAWKTTPERARDLHERNLGTWFRWKVNRRDITSADLQCVREFSPDLATRLQST